MSEKREFDIDGSSRDEGGFYAATDYCQEDKFYQNIHVIEYSAYEQSQSLLKIATEALERLLEEPTWREDVKKINLIAREALLKIKGE